MWKSKLLVASATALALSMVLLNPAKADWHLDNVDYFDDDGDWVEFWSDDEGHRLIFVIEDGETIHYIAVGFDNPNPEEGSGSEENWDHLADLLKKYGAGLERMTNLAGTPLGHVLLRNGNLIDPYHNPSDVGYEDTGGFGGGGGFTPGNGSPTEQLKRQVKKGGKSKGDGEDGDDLKSGDVGLFDDDMPGPPEIVNPNPTSHNFDRVGKDHDGRSGGSGGGNSAGGGGGGGGGGGAAGAAR